MSNIPTSAQIQSTHTENTYGKIKDKVAVITDTKYTPQLIPLILHYHAVLGPGWPIVFFTSEELIANHLTDLKVLSGPWQQAIKEKRIELRTVPHAYNLTSRDGVNVYLSRPWLYEQLAPAQHVLIFQADAILCANSPHRVDDFLKYDFVGPLIGPRKKIYNGGLSLRNRTMILDILREGNNWEKSLERKQKNIGEDGWFSRRMADRRANLPEKGVALRFALQYKWQLDTSARPLGYHKIQKNAPEMMDEIAAWCPEIILTKAGTLESV